MEVRGQLWGVGYFFPPEPVSLGSLGSVVVPFNPLSHLVGSVFGFSKLYSPGYRTTDVAQATLENSACLAVLGTRITV